MNDLLYISQSTGHESNDLIKQIEITNTSLLEEYFGYIEMNIYCADDAYKGQYNYYANCIIETDTGTSNITFNGGSDYKQEPQPFEGIYYNSGDENITINIESLDIMNN